MLLLWQQFNPENIQDMHSDIKSKHLTQCNSHKKLYVLDIIYSRTNHYRRVGYICRLNFPKINLISLFIYVPQLKLLLLTKLSLNINAQNYATKVCIMFSMAALNSSMKARH